MAIHAIELYLNAFLLQAKIDPRSVRKLQHNMGARAELCLAHGLNLKKRTAAHLHAISDDREYLVTRYDPENKAILSNPTRLAASLEEVAQKVRAAVK
jgi:hypothetical protein